MKIGVLGQIAQFLIEDAQALSRNLVRLDVIDTNLQVFKTSIVQPLDSIRRKVITIRNQSRDNSTRTNVADDVVKLRVHHRLGAGNRNEPWIRVAQPFKTE